MKTGRPSLYTPDLVEQIADRLRQGEPLAAICRDDGMPCDDTVRNWMEAQPEVSRVIARARELGFDAIAVDGLNIVDNLDEDPASRRVRSDYRLKLLAKWDPKRYGDRQVLAGDPEAPLTGPTEAQQEARLSELLAKLGATLP